jgi:hypothetical protein
MKNQFLAIFFAVIPFICSAQSSIPQKEISFGMSPGSGSSFAYKVGTTRAMWRLATFSVNYNKYTENSNEFKRYSTQSYFNLQVGREWRKSLTNQIEFRYGADLSVGYSIFRSKYEWIPVQQTQTGYFRSFMPGVNLVVGFNYLLSESLILGVEFLPGYHSIIGVNETKINNAGNDINRKSDVLGSNISLSPSNILFTLTYRLQKNKK